MSRCSENAVYAFDQEGVARLLGTGYSYAGGYYRNINVLGDKRYEVVDSGCGDEPQETGEYVPQLRADDLASFFTEERTKNMQFAANELGLTKENARSFWRVFRDWEENTVEVAVIDASGEERTRFNMRHLPEQVRESEICDLARMILDKGIGGFREYVRNFAPKKQKVRKLVRHKMKNNYVPAPPVPGSYAPPALPVSDYALPADRNYQ